MKVIAKLDGYSDYPDTITGDLVAECPYCGTMDAFVSTGQHNPSGHDTVVCCSCKRTFDIEWDKND
jgi:DNA-directed RNA polymerase subunit RPC12/RpoP